MAQPKRDDLRQHLLREGAVKPATANTQRHADREASRLAAIEARRKDAKGQK